MRTMPEPQQCVRDTFRADTPMVVGRTLCGCTGGGAAVSL